MIEKAKTTEKANADSIKEFQNKVKNLNTIIKDMQKDIDKYKELDNFDRYV